MQKYRGVLLASWLVGCAASHARIYAGALQPIAGTCDVPSRAELSVRGASVLFTPASGTVVLHGLLEGHRVTAQETLVTPEHTAYKLALMGLLEADVISGTYTTPRCRYNVRLTLTQD